MLLFVITYVVSCQKESITNPKNTSVEVSELSQSWRVALDTKLANQGELKQHGSKTSISGQDAVQQFQHIE